jgi:hypothetical protein
VSTVPILLENSQEAASATTPVIIITIPTTTTAAPTIQSTAVRDIAVEQDVLPDTEDAKESDIMIFDLSGIDTNAAILHNWESYKPDCVLSARCEKEPLALW